MLAQRQPSRWANVGTPTLGQRGYVNWPNVGAPTLAQRWANIGPMLVYRHWVNVGATLRQCLYANVVPTLAQRTNPRWANVGKPMLDQRLCVNNDPTSMCQHWFKISVEQTVELRNQWFETPMWRRCNIHMSKNVAILFRRCTDWFKRNVEKDIKLIYEPHIFAI